MSMMPGNPCGKDADFPSGCECEKCQTRRNMAAAVMIHRRVEKLRKEEMSKASNNIVKVPIMSLEDFGKKNGRRTKPKSQKNQNKKIEKDDVEGLIVFAKSLGLKTF